MDDTANPNHADYLPEDEYVLGKEPDGRGHPRIVNARLVDGHPGEVLRNTSEAGKQDSTSGAYFGAPDASFFLGGR